MNTHPPIPRRPISAAWGRNLVADVRARTFSGGPGLRISQTPGGISAHLARRLRAPSAEAVPEPWDLLSYDPASGDIELQLGYIEIHGDTGTDYHTPTSGALTLASITGAVYVWARLHWNGASWDTPTLGSTPAAFPGSDADDLYKLLWRFTDSAPTMRYHRGNIEFTGWRQ